MRNSFQQNLQGYAYRLLSLMFRFDIFLIPFLAIDLLKHVVCVSNEIFPELDEINDVLEETCTETIVLDIIPSLSIPITNYEDEKIGAVEPIETGIEMKYARQKLGIEPRNLFKYELYP